MYALFNTELPINDFACYFLQINTSLHTKYIFIIVFFLWKYNLHLYQQLQLKSTMIFLKLPTIWLRFVECIIQFLFGVFIERLAYRCLHIVDFWPKSHANHRTVCIRLTTRDIYIRDLYRIQFKLFVQLKMRIPKDNKWKKDESNRTEFQTISG